MNDFVIEPIAKQLLKETGFNLIKWWYQIEDDLGHDNSGVDEDDILSEDKNEALVDSGMNDAARKGKFLLYWKTTTLTSTSTSYTVTYSIGTLECTPSGFTLSACGKK